VYKIIDYPGPDLLKTAHPDYDIQIWHLANLRGLKYSQCALCKRSVGKKAFCPITFKGNRQARICTGNHKIWEDLGLK
jgi:hypothetical protein